METTSPRKHKRHSTGEYFPFVSANICRFITEQLVQHDYDFVIEYGSGGSTIYYLQALLEAQKRCVFTSVEYNPDWFHKMVKTIQAMWPQDALASEKHERHPWPFDKCKRYIHGRNASRLEIPEGMGRLKKAQEKMGGLWSFRLPLLRFFPNCRPIDGFYSASIKNSIDMQLILRTELFKDQYGESPIREEYVQNPLKPLQSRIDAQKEVSAAFLIDGGPRGDILKTILDLDDQYTCFRPTVFMCDANKVIYANQMKRRPKGVFVDGSNQTIDGSPLYTRKLSGAKARFLHDAEHVDPSSQAKKELWFYRSNAMEEKT